MTTGPIAIDVPQTLKASLFYTASAMAKIGILYHSEAYYAIDEHRKPYCTRSCGRPVHVAPVSPERAQENDRVHRCGPCLSV